MRVVGPAHNTNLGTANGAGAVILTTPVLPVAAGVLVNISGQLSINTTVNAIRDVQIRVALVGAPGVPIGDTQGSGSVLAATATKAGIEVPFTVDYSPTAPNPQFVVTAWCDTGGASSGDLETDGDTCVATAVQVG